MKYKSLVPAIMLVIGLVAGYFGYMVVNNNDNGTVEHMATESLMYSSDMHSGVEVDAKLPIPSVTLTATKDTKDGYNLQIATTNFEFTPDKAGMENSPNTGHAHIFVNGEKLGRVYGEWYYLSSTHLKDGENEVEVTLNANDHSDWLYNDEHIASKVAVTK